MFFYCSLWVTRHPVFVESSGRQRQQTSSLVHVQPASRGVIGKITDTEMQYICLDQGADLLLAADLVNRRTILSTNLARTSVPLHGSSSYLAQQSGRWTVLPVFLTESFLSTTGLFYSIVLLGRRYLFMVDLPIWLGNMSWTMLPVCSQSRQSCQ